MFLAGSSAPGPNFIDLLFSEQNLTNLATGVTDALPLVLTGALTLGGALLTTGMTNRARRKEALAIAAQTSADRAKERERLEAREDALRYQEDYRRIGLSMVTNARRLGDLSLQLSRIDKKGVKPVENPVAERARLDAEADMEVEALIKAFNEMSVFGPSDVAERARSIPEKGIVLQIVSSVGLSDETITEARSAYSQATEDFLAALRPYLGLTFEKKEDTP